MRVSPGTFALLVVLSLSAPRLGAQGNWVRTGVLLPDEGYTGIERHFGWDASLSGNWALVAAPPLPGGSSDGSAYLYELRGTEWTLAHELSVPGGTPADDFARSVALSDGRALVGAPGESHGAGAVYIFEANGATQRFAAPDGAPGDELGAAEVIVGDVALASAPGRDRVHVLTRVNAVWTATAELTPTTSETADFGRALAFDGTRAVVGAPEEEAAYVFVRSGDSWRREVRLETHDAQAEHFGSSVALDGTTLVVGAPEDDGSGRVFVYRLDGSTWNADGVLAGQNLSPEHSFGESVSVSDTTLVVGAPGDDEDFGSMHVYARDASGWHGVDEFVPDPLPGEGRFGYHVAVQRGTILGNIGLNESGTIAYVGALYVWTQIPVVRAGRTSAAPSPGSVPLTGTTVNSALPLELLAGPNHAGDRFLLLASLAGNRPGFGGAALRVPLNPDALLLGLCSGRHLFRPGSGTLDREGRARVVAELPPAWTASGLELEIAYVVFDARTDLPSAVSAPFAMHLGR